MDKLLDLLKTAAPALATVVAGPMGGMAVKVIAEKLGVAEQVDEVVTALQNDPEAYAKLKEIDLKAFEVETQDRASARALVATAIQSDDPFVRRFTYYFIGFWSIFSTVIIPCMIFMPIPTDNVRFADTILGFLLGTIIASMFAFLLGSSFGSRQKDKK